MKSPFYSKLYIYLLFIVDLLFGKTHFRNMHNNQYIHINLCLGYLQNNRFEFTVGLQEDDDNRHDWLDEAKLECSLLAES